MENEIFTPLLEQFMISPLVTWVKTFGPLAEGNGADLDEYVALVDGVFLNQVMFQINPKLESQRVNKKVNNDASLRIHNLSILVRQIKFYYQETLQQLIMMSLPNVLVIGKNPFSEQGTEEVKKLLLLLLGCAVQCQKKEEFIGRIQSLNFDTKAAVAAHIQEVINNQENVFDLRWVEETDMSQEELEPLLKNMALHLKRLIDERDEHSETIIELSEEQDGLHFLPHASSSVQSPCGSPGMKQTESRQLADAKAKIRRLRDELDENTEELLDCKEELEQMEIELKRLQQENMNLLSDAHSARMYRDELDALQEKAVRLDQLESEVSKYKERLHDTGFYKARVEELKEDNQVLFETKTMLEDQLEGTRAHSDKLRELEKENLQLKAKLHDMKMECDMDRKKIEELMEENMTLEMAQKQSMDESLHLGWQLEQIYRTSELSEAPQKSLGHEVNELTSSSLLKLETENQSLTKTVEELRSSMDSAEGNTSKILKVQKENQRLNKKMKILEQENEHLNKTVSSLRQRSQISAEARVKDIQKENKILHESIKETSSKLSKIEFEKRQIKKELEHYKEKGEQAEELENELHHLEKENELLQKKITNLKTTCEKIEALKQENSELERENRKFKKALDSFQNVTLQLQSLEKENSQLDGENLELRSNVESLKCASMKMAQLQLENKELESEKEQLKKGLELMKATFEKTECLQVSYQGLDTENQRLQKDLENSKKKIQQLENELQDLEMENQTLQRNLEELKVSSKRLEQLEKENKSLEQETSQLEKDKKQLEKENKRLRQQAEVKGTTLEENNVKIGNSEKENKTLYKEIGVYKESYIHLKELVKENKELMKRASIEIKTLVTLRELLSQLKGNLEEENRHLLDQIQTLMLQNRKLLEQHMESKDLFHVEQRQYIEKLNELRRQKEKLERKIMDQYKFSDPAPPRRRGNWITLKMRKLMTSKKDINREHQKSLTLTPTCSDSSEGFLQLPHQDSQVSSSAGSNSLEDGQTLGTKKSSTMNDLVRSMVLAGGQWTDTTSSEDVSPQGISDDSSMGSRVHASRSASLDSSRTSTSNSNNNASLHEVKGTDTIESRPQSHSSGEFSLLHDREAWSSRGSSPIQHLKRQGRSSPGLQHKMPETLESRAHHKFNTGSPGSEVVTLQQFLEESNKLTSIQQIKSSSQKNLLDEVMRSLSVSSDFLRKNKPVSCGLARSASGRSPGDFYDRQTTKPEQFVRPGPQKTEDTYFISSPGKPTLGTQGKIKLVKETSLSRQSKDSNPYATYLAQAV